MKIKVLFFAGLKEKIGASEAYLEFSPEQEITINDVTRRVKEQFTTIANELDRVMIAVNEEVVDSDERIREDDVVAFIPPVSGG